MLVNDKIRIRSLSVVFYSRLPSKNTCITGPPDVAPEDTKPDHDAMQGIEVPPFCSLYP